MIAKLLLQNLIWVVVLGALLFVPRARCIGRRRGCSLPPSEFSASPAASWLARHDPALLAERMRPMMQPDQPAADKTFVLVFGFAALIWFLAIGLDIREHGIRMPWGLQALGLAMLLFSSGFILWVMRENSFAAPVIRLQTERGHRVITTGPYALVRHPMYSGTVLFFVGAPLLLGSWWGVAMSPLLALLVRGPHRHRGTRADRGPARLCRLHRAGALPAGARTLVRVILRPA